ncbi:ABC transporter ATP-binding protein [Candidatus Gracilibacteria bacterium]|nr:ABC transporter ATP-binding protein [Candidatus Gracilibacteria bacterium]
MIQIQSLTKSFGDSHIFQDADISIAPGDFIALIGPSGSGKSTFLNLVSGIDRDFEGSIQIDKKDISKLSDTQITSYRGKNISYIFQNFKLVENLTVTENVDLIIQMNDLERNFSTPEILKIVGLSHKAETYVFNLSGGESQRVAIARAFVGKTKILLADEPTGSLDQKNKSVIMDLIAELHKKVGNTIVMITHDPEVAELADTTYTLKNNTFKKNDELL